MQRVQGILGARTDLAALDSASHELLESSDLFGLVLRPHLAAYRKGYEVGRERGFAEGHAAANAEIEAGHHELARQVMAGELVCVLVDQRRRGPGGRGRFGDPRSDGCLGQKTGTK